MRAYVAVLIVPGFLLGFLLAVAMTGVATPGPAAHPDSELILPPDLPLRVMARRLRAKSEVIDLLLGGELTLFEAAARFRDFNAGTPEMEDLTWKCQAGSDDGEKLCRQVIRWAESRLTEACVPSEAVRAARLEKELLDHIQAHGGVNLPTGAGEGWSDPPGQRARLRERR